MTHYDAPIAIRRPGKSHRYDAFSPKLGRALTFYSRHLLDQWLLLEGAPHVRRFCERPAYLRSKAGKQRLADFWVLHQDYEEFVLLGNPESEAGDFEMPQAARLRWITPATLAQQATLVTNWRSILPYVAAYRRWLKDADIAQAVALCNQPILLSDLERALSKEDPLWARTVVFTALAKGHLRAPSLSSAPWDLNTVILRADHAD